jgi:two-component system response regulator AtoC
MKSNRVKILIVDDDEKILFAFQEVLKAEGYQSIVARNGEEALSKIASGHPAAVFMDITMPKLDGLEALRRIKQRSPAIPVVLITGFGTMQTAIKAIQFGAFEYLTKPLDVNKIRDVIARALTSGREKHSPAGEQVSFQADIVNRYEIIGNSPQMQEIYKLIGSISTTPNHTSVLILGESGTGKELVARAIHANGEHAGEPFIPINCTALPESLLESELFGHEKGAFTGASDRKPGKFELAGQGTIFLDEIGALSPTLQQKLLRVLQEREFERVGGNVPQLVGARFIAATNQDLVSGVKNKSFREDLFFRLNVAVVHLPPLHERREDIPLLATYFLSKYNDQVKRGIKGYSREAMKTLQQYAYPGNIRELENLIERAVMLTKGELILPDALGEMVAPSPPTIAPLPVVSQVFSKSRAHLLDLFEKQFVVEQLKKHHGNVTAAAQTSRMTRQNFQRLMNKHKISAPPFRK